MGTTRLNRPSLKVTSPGSPQQKKKQMKNVPQIVGRLQVGSYNHRKITVTVMLQRFGADMPMQTV